MFYTQIFTGLPIILTAISLIISIVVLIRQREFQKDITTLQNKLTARREIATTKMRYLSLIEEWVDDGLEIRKEVLPLESYLDNLGKKTDYYVPDPKLDFSKIRDKYLDWSKTSEKLIVFAQIYDPKAEKNLREWDENFDGKLPEDLPNLLELYKVLLGDYAWKHMSYYEDLQYPEKTFYEPESLMPNVGEYIIPTYKKIHITLEGVKEFVVTEKLSYKE